MADVNVVLKNKKTTEQDKKELVPEWIEMNFHQENNDGCTDDDNKQLSRFEVSKVHHSGGQNEKKNNENGINNGVDKSNNSDSYPSTNSTVGTRTMMTAARDDDEEDEMDGEIEDVGNGDAGAGGSFALAANQTSHHSIPSHNSHSNTYDTRYAKSLRYMTREALPRIDNYRNILSVTTGSAYRPTLDELHNATINDGKGGGNVENKQGAHMGNKSGSVKFGWIRGVFIRCLLNIWGVMLFLRLSWVIGQAGIFQGCLVISFACVVTTLTSLSASAIATNGQVKGGGTYYLISRSLGPEFGGSIGLIFSLANAVACAMYVVGFCESFTDMLKSVDATVVGDKHHDIRIIGTITLVILLGITVVGMEWEARAQVGLLVILLVAMVDFFIGSFLTPSVEKQSMGFMGYSFDVFQANWNSDYRDETFFSVFAVFFPAATGILAGANISGDLADPGSSIPKGTLLAILVTTLSYLGFAVISGAVVVRGADGSIESFNNGTFENCVINGTCKYGLIYNFQVMEMVSGFGPLIYCGCFAATLSSALASLVSAPKVFQALCEDKLYPYIHVFAKGYGRNNEPIRGYILTFFISLGFVLIAELNAIAPIISNFFLASYGLINFSCFHASLVKSPGFRPSFQYYNMWVSLIGAVLCIVVMFIINWWTALITFGICFALYIYISYAKPDVNWGSSTQAQMYRNALQSVIRLNQVEEHVKNYRPQVLVLTSLPSSRPPLVDFVHSITKNLSLMVCGHILTTPVSQKMRNVYIRQSYRWLNKRKIKAFYNLVETDNMVLGAKSLMQVVGMGKLRPNTLFLGYKSNWNTCDPSETLDYFTIIHESFDNHMAVGILRLQEGLDYSSTLDEVLLTSDNLLSAPNQLLNTSIDSNIHLRHNMSMSHLSVGGGSSAENSPPSTPGINRNESFAISENPEGTNKIHIGRACIANDDDIPEDVLSNVNQFQRKQKKGTIDVWWLYDDGGLSLLLPYILSTRKQWCSCKLRVFSLANRKDELDKEQRNMAALLSKFRIDYSDVVVIPDISKKPSEASVYEFNKLVEKFMEKQDGATDEDSLVITAAELLALKDKTNRHIRLREQLIKYASSSSLIVMTLPMPRKGTVSAALYMAWLETLTRDMPPFLLVRGNQTSVLTFYS